MTINDKLQGGKKPNMRCVFILENRCNTTGNFLHIHCAKWN